METYHGYVRTPGDAIKLFEACRLGLLPRVQRRLSEKERQSIRSGSVFVWDEREAGMRRWTDGKSWSASRVSGSFLTYREMEGKRGGGFGGGRRGNGKTPESGRASDEDLDDGEPEGYRYKADGLMKQSFSITTSTGQHLHLISYYSRPQPGQPDLSQPSTDPSLRAIIPAKGMYPESSIGETNQTPALTRAPMQHPPYMVSQQHPHAHHSAPYAPPYANQGYGWPPSPVSTPPNYVYPGAPYHQNGHALPLPHPSQGQPYHAHATPAHHQQQYPERAHLPPPNPTGHPYQSPSLSASHSPPRLGGSPRQGQLHEAATAGSVEPRTNATSTRDSQGTLPALNAMTTGAGQSTTLAAISTPPSRTLSVSPPRSSHSDSTNGINGHKTSLSSLLHPTPPSSEQGSTNGATADLKPCGLAAENGGVSEDARALKLLDRKFCI